MPNCQKSNLVPSEKNVKDAAGSLQAIHHVYQQDETETLFLVDTENAFSSINRTVMLHNTSITYPLITPFIANYYMEPTKLFVAENHEIKSREGTTQGHPTATGTYALEVTPLIHCLSKFIFVSKHKGKEVVFAENFTVLEKVSEIEAYWMY